MAEGLAGRGHDVTVLVTNTDRQTIEEQRNGVRVIKAGRILHLASTPISTAMLQQAAGLRADIVNLHMPFPPGDLAAIAVKNAQLVVTYHSDIVRQRRLLQLYRPLLNTTLRCASRIIATSHPYIQSSEFLRSHANKCRVVPLSVDAARYRVIADRSRLRRRFQRTPDDCIVLAVGVLRYYKGLDVLLDAMTQLDATLVIVGAGPEEQRLRTLAQAFGMARRVHFVGRVSDDDLPGYYHCADVFVLASQLRAEAFGIVQLEAMAAGVPVVSTELGTGTSVVNHHSQTGFVVPPGDPHALAQAIKVLLANPELRQYMGTMGRYRVANEYTHDLMVERTLDVYREARANA